MQRALLGIDVGTTNTKVVAFSTRGVELAKASTATQALHPQPDWTEYDAEALWKNVCTLLKKVVKELPDNTQPVAISVTGMAEAGVPLDASGRALYPAISWLDRRTAGELDTWQEVIGKDRTADITGLPMNTAAGILRLLWLRSCAPEIFRQTKRWLNVPDYIAYKLSSVAATDYSLASRMMVLDLKKKCWSDELLNEIDIAPEMLGTCVASGEQIGAVTEQASSATHLPAGLPVCAGGHDHICAAFGLGVTKPGEILDSMGTAEALVVTLDTANPSAGIANKGIAQGVHVVPGLYYALSGLYYSGGSVDWVRQLLFSTLGQEAASSAAYAELLRLARKVNAGSDGVYFLPHLQQANPPVFDPRSRGAFVGLTSGTGPGHLARAVMEGLAFEFQQLRECVSEMLAIDSLGLTASGGGTRNGLLMEIKASVAGKPVTVPDVDEATCLGAALLAGLGAGVYRDVEDATDQVQFTSRTVQSKPDLHTVYRRNYQRVFLPLYESLRHVNDTISELEDSLDT